ncbi:MAG: hypothetical protein FWD82_07685, partial [Defluviitaleaceae bacterium]|nr:hypothetical protein [Defluviitaleaceae bacterium]
FSSDIWQFMYALYGENVPTERVAGNQTNISLTEAERLVADFMLQKYPSVVLDNLYMSLMAPNLEQIRELNGGLPRGIDGAFTFSFELFSFDDSGYYTVGVRRGLPETCAVSTFFYRYNGVEYVEVMRGSGSFFKSTAGHLMFIESRELGGPAIISNIILDGHHVIKHTLIDDDYDWEIAEEIRQTHEAIESYEQKVLRITNTIYEEAMEHTNQFLSWREHYLFFIQTNLWWTEPPRLFDENSAFAILHGGENPFLIVMNRATQEYRLFRYSENLNIVEEIDDGGGMRLEGIEFFGDIWQFTVNLYGRG